MANPKELVFIGIENGFINLRTKPTARLGFSYIPQFTNRATSPERLLVFLGGLDNPKIVWQRLLDQLSEQSRRNGVVLPPMLLNDRFGFGQSDTDPTDAGTRRPRSSYRTPMIQGNGRKHRNGCLQV